MESGRDYLRSKLFEAHAHAQMCDISRQISTKEASYHKQICGFEKRLSSDFLDMQVRIADKLAKDVVEGVRTPDWVKNMLAGIPEQLSRAEYEILEEILKEKNRFMEKKTKKMTKAEAFEYLKGKKVLCKEYDKMEAVQGFVKSLGFHWSDYSEDPMLTSILFLGEDERLTFSVSLKRFEDHKYEEISADDILSIEIIEEKYESEFNYDKAVELAKPLMHYLSETGHTEVISVCKESISAIPMGTFLYKG